MLSFGLVVYDLYVTKEVFVADVWWGNLLIFVFAVFTTASFVVGLAILLLAFVIRTLLRAFGRLVD